MTLDRLNPEYVKKVRDIVNNCPYFSLLSMSISSVDSGESILKVEVSNKHLQPFGVVHGGVFASLIDAAAFWALFVEIPEDNWMTTVEMKVNYLSPATQGVLIAKGRRIRLGRTIGVGEATVTDENGKLLACGMGTFIILPGKGLDIPLPNKFI